MSGEFIFFIAILLGASCVIGALAYVRSKMTENLLPVIVEQPASGRQVTDSFLVMLALLETPPILSVVIAIFSYDLMSYANVVNLFPSLYLVLFSLASAINVYFTGKALARFGELLGNHPRYESKFITQMVVFSSSLQVPLILFFVAIVYHKYYILGLLGVLSFSYSLLFFFIAHFLPFVLVQYGLLRGIYSVIDALTSFYFFYPEKSKDYFLLIIVQIGFLQAPFIFAFIVFLLLFKVYLIGSSLLYIIFGFISLVFSSMACFVIGQSSCVASSACLSSSHDNSVNKKIFNIALFSQAFLDARVLYVFFIFLLSLRFL
jgi:F0F1-type ATP synthase membrane subunit c/vacuolar-type H+-ATPase subunit K